MKSEKLMKKRLAERFGAIIQLFSRTAIGGNRDRSNKLIRSVRER
jgi:hypothetical protein